MKYRITRCKRGIVNLYKAKVQEFYIIEVFKKTWLRRPTWKDFVVLTCWGGDYMWETPEFKTLEDAKVYLAGLQEVYEVKHDI